MQVVTFRMWHKLLMDPLLNTIFQDMNNVFQRIGIARKKIPWLISSSAFGPHMLVNNTEQQVCHNFRTLLFYQRINSTEGLRSFSWAFLSLSSFRNCQGSNSPLHYITYITLRNLKLIIGHYWLWFHMGHKPRSSGWKSCVFLTHPCTLSSFLCALCHLTWMC